jgi:mRNA interferase HigB
MRIISRRKLVEFWTTHPDAKLPLEVWYHEAVAATWSTPQDIKRRYPKASILPRDRVVFDIKGNTYRLVVVVIYRFGTVYLRFVGTHAEYDKIDATTI